MSDNGPVAGETIRLAFIASSPTQTSIGDDVGERPPIVLIHGSPGDAAGFDSLRPLLNQAGYRVIAVDLPGFGESTKRPPSMSVKAHARAVLALLDSLKIDRAHVVGWSLGGGVVLHMVDLAPDRVASMTMLAASGSQDAEGSRSHFFEHFKYRAGLVLFPWLPRLVPHFGLLEGASESEMCRSLQNFDDSDMRPLSEIMRRVQTPTLILHGRRDFLVPDWAAELHHELIRPSRLVMIDALHFLPFMQEQETAAQLAMFMSRHDEPGVPAHRFAVNFTPARAHAMGFVGRWAAWMFRYAPWWCATIIFALVSLRRPGLAAALGAMVASQIKVDFAVCVCGLLVGRLLVPMVCWSRAGNLKRVERVFRQEVIVSKSDWARRLRRRPPGFVLGIVSSLRPDVRLVAPCAMRLMKVGAINTVLFAVGVVATTGVVLFIQFVPAMVIAGVLSSYFRLDYELGSVGGWVLRFMLLWITFGVVLLYVGALPYVMTWTGRRLLMAKVRRFLSPEFWPVWIFYAPLSPYYAYLMFRAGHPVRFTACNPGIPYGGGVAGESKFQIQASLDTSTGLVLPTVRIDAHGSPAVRAAAARQVVAENPALGGYPIILKPDMGYRGFAVRLARSGAEFEGYFNDMTQPAIVQAYHPGPHEVGILWSRDPRWLYHTPDEQPRTRSTGFIYSITRKEFPRLIGDGTHTFEELIYRDKRLRCQAHVFLARFSDEASRVLTKGEVVRLAQSGNHCQGTLFRDGADLITPELTEAIDRLASSFGSEERRGLLDIGRFDVRFESYDELKQGRNFAVLELNGTTGESTNVYDPDKSIFWTYKTLYGLWRLLFVLGTWRASLGAPTMPTRELIRSIGRAKRERRGSWLAD